MRRENNRGRDSGRRGGSSGGFGGRSGGSSHSGPRRDFNDGPREMHKAICADCKVECDVPFKPSGERPVYCRDCFAKHKPPRF